ncbi:histone deacetylase [bacterium]|nr:histone deacetylase [bacterium]
MLILHSPRCLDYAAAGHPESPDRVRHMVDCLQPQGHTWREPTPCADEDLLRVHSPEHLAAVRRGDYVDHDTPWFGNSDHLARLAAGSAILAADQALAVHRAFSLQRPPGHHAERDRIMGFCHYNNVAVAVARLLDQNHLERIAILDFDCHHGNGTEDIFLGDSRVLYVSLHQYPCYPGTGASSRRNCLNFPLPPGTGPERFLVALDEAIGRIHEFPAQLLAISAGFDAYRGDPITEMGLEIDTFRAIGMRLARIPVPSFAVLEGGYAAQVGSCVAAFAAGWAPAPAPSGTDFLGFSGTGWYDSIPALGKGLRPGD